MEMVVEPIVSYAIESLLQGTQNEVTFLCGVGNQVENSRRWLEALHRFLQDADKYSKHGDNRLRWWVSQIREVALDLEAAIETYDFKVASRKFIALSPRKLHKVRSKIKEIRERVSNLLQMKEAIGVNKLDVASSNVGQAVPRLTFGHPRDPDIVGFEEYIKDLMAQLIKENSPQVVAICGMGGLGKTTLAREVYNHCEVRSYFECFGWVFVSQDYQVRKIYEELLIDFVRPDKQTTKEIRSMTDNQIVERLCKIQKDKKCLVILDDVWEIDLWKDLNCVLPKDETSSRILLTTRNRSVAFRAHQGDVLIHEPRCLDATDGWKLLEKRTSFRSIINNPTNLEDHKEKLEELREELLEHCAGLPLAISILGGHLSSEIRTINDWEMLRRNIKKCINRGKIGGEQVNSVSMVLGLSYDALPYHLKQCFLFLAHFPKNFKIKVKELCQMWIAEGFVNQEDEARTCFRELVDRYLVQVREFDSTSERAKTCSIHDLIRDYCLLRAQEENFLQIVDPRNEHDAAFFGASARCQKPSDHKVRRLAIHLNYNITDELSSVIKSGDRCLRSFICFNPLIHPLYQEETLKKLFKRFHLLRILKFENSTRAMMMLPKEIGNLVHLRFLSLHNSHVEKLPSSIGNLKQLQCLDLRTNWSIKLPNVVLKLEELVHLYLPYISDKSDEILQLDNLKSLKTLVNISTKSCDLNNLVDLTNLVELKIYVDKKFEEFVLPADFTFEHLQSLVMMVSTVFDAIDITPFVSACPSILKLRVELPITKLPELSSNIIKLTLRRTCLDHDPMSTLKELPKLRILVLGSNAFRGTEMACSEGGFPRLESLSLIELEQLNQWSVEEGTLLSLRHLHIEGCKRLRAIPDGLRYVTSLHKMISKGMPWEFNKRIKREGEDFDKVRHISSIEFLHDF